MSKKKKKRFGFGGVIQFLSIFIGICLLAYPIVVDRLNSQEAENVISEYTSYAETNEEEHQAIFENAHAYNDRLSGTLNDYEGYIVPYYEQIIPGEGAFAWLEIPDISVNLPIYHGTEEESLQVGVGHLEDSSLPVGGQSTHAVLTGHSGMIGSRMFDDIRLLEEGDIFFVHVMGEVMAYKVYSQEIVLPDEVREHIQIEKNRDLVTLVTCYPYGKNSHRLLVHGERCELPESPHEPELTPVLLNNRTIPFFAAIGALVVIALLLLLLRRGRGLVEIGHHEEWWHKDYYSRFKCLKRSYIVLYKDL